MAHQVDIEEFKRIVRDLFQAATELNAARDELRSLMENIAGCPLDNFSIDDLSRYLELMEQEYKGKM